MMLVPLTSSKPFGLWKTLTLQYGSLRPFEREKFDVENSDDLINNKPFWSSPIKSRAFLTSTDRTTGHG